MIFVPVFIPILPINTNFSIFIACHSIFPSRTAFLSLFFVFIEEMDPLDASVLAAIVLALIIYFTKGKIWALDDEATQSISPSSSSNDLVETLKSNGKKAIVFFGSQTGTAEDYAHKFSKELQAKFGIPTMVCDLADYSFDNFENLGEEIEDFKLVTFFMATYGEGEPTDNAVDFLNYLENDCENLNTLNYSLFALGNSTYEFYNATGKKLDEDLRSKGAKLLGEIGLGDDGTGSMDEDFLAWKDQFMDQIKNDLKLDEHEVEYQPGLEIVELTTEIDENVSLGEPNSKYINPKTDEEKSVLRLGPFDHTHPYLSPITKSSELFNSKDRFCIHAEFDLSDSNLKYSTGDHIAIWPSNSNEKISQLIKILGLNGKKDKVIAVKSLDQTIHPPFPSPTTYETVLRHYLEISGPVSRQFLKSIVQFSPNEETKKNTIEISDNKEKFHQEITEKGLNIGDVLENLSKNVKWDTVPFNFIIESIGKLQPRYYSISSSSSNEKQTVHITAVVEQSSIGEKSITGVTTNLLLNIQKEQNKRSLELIENYDLQGPRGSFDRYKLPIHIRRSTFKLPSNPATPIIMVGPGSGVAPFRGFIREKIKQVENGMKVGEMLLFFGCRSSDEDFIYKDEWVEYSKKLGEKFQMVTAFSRESSKKIYVQHKMAEYKERVGELMDLGANFYICGDASSMARDVQNQLIQILSERKNIEEPVAVEMVKSLKINNRFQEDVW